MSRCIVVLSPPRCGSSAVAGVLHRLGVWMGDELQPPDVLNKRGYYEDRLWQRINKSIVGVRYDVQELEAINGTTTTAYQQVIAHYDNQYAIWGFKDPRACFTLQFIWPLLKEAGVDTRVIVVQREFEAAVRSLKNHSEIGYGGQFVMTYEEAENRQTIWHDAASRRLADYHATWNEGASLRVHFEDLLADPQAEIQRLADFCFNGCLSEGQAPKPVEARLITAARFLEPELKTF